jgi:hypothetical protein
MGNAIRMTAHTIGAAVDFNELDAEDVFVDAPAHDALARRVRTLEDALRRLEAACIESGDLYYASIARSALGRTPNRGGEHG